MSTASTDVMSYKSLTFDTGATVTLVRSFGADEQPRPSKKLEKMYDTEDAAVVSDGDPIDFLMKWAAPLAVNRRLHLQEKSKHSNRRISYSIVDSKCSAIDVKLLSAIKAADPSWIVPWNSCSLLVSGNNDAPNMAKSRRATMYSDLVTADLEQGGFVAEEIYEDVRGNFILDFSRKSDRLTLIISESVQCLSFLDGEFASKTVEPSAEAVTAIADYIGQLIR